MPASADYLISTIGTVLSMIVVNACCNLVWRWLSVPMHHL
jgi:hypothetical protein